MTGIFTTKYFGTYGKEIGNADFLVSFLSYGNLLRKSYKIKNAPLWMRLVRRCRCKLKLARTSAQRVASDSLIVCSGNTEGKEVTAK